MAKSGSKVQQFILRCIVPILCSIVVGFMFHQENVFNRNYGAFQFVWSPVIASVFFYLLIFVRPRDAGIGVIILLFLTFLTTGSTRPAFILRDILYVAGIVSSIFVYFKYFRHDSPLNHTRPAFLLAGIYGIVNIVVTELHLGILRSLAMEDTGGTVVSLASTTAYFGLLIGFAVGCGIALNEKFFGAKRNA